MKHLVDGKTLYDNPNEVPEGSNCPNENHSWFINQFNYPCPGCGEEKFEVYLGMDGLWHVAD